MWWGQYCHPGGQKSTEKGCVSSVLITVREAQKGTTGLLPRGYSTEQEFWMDKLVITAWERGREGGLS